MTKVGRDGGVLCVVRGEGLGIRWRRWGGRDEGMVYNE